MSKTELNELAKTFDIATPVKIKKDDLTAQILEIAAARSGLELANGVLDVLPEGYGFLRRAGFLAGVDDIYISQSQIRRFELRRGDLVAGQVRKPKDNEKYYGIVKVETVNGLDPESIRERPHFDSLTPVHPTERFALEQRGVVSARVIDLFAPIGKGQRVLVAAPPKAGKTTLIKEIANAISANDPNADVVAVLVDERTEDVTDLTRSIAGEVVATTFDEYPEAHLNVAELVLERAKRLVELGRDAVIVLDSITRLTRAYNGAAPASSRTIPGGLEAARAAAPSRSSLPSSSRPGPRSTIRYTRSSGAARTPRSICRRCWRKRESSRPSTSSVRGRGTRSCCYPRPSCARCGCCAGRRSRWARPISPSWCSSVSGRPRGMPSSSPRSPRNPSRRSSPSAARG
jgi:transcription termination factor Rho